MGESFPRSFQIALLDHLGELRRKGMAPGTIELARRRLGTFGLFLEGLPRPPKTLSHVTSELVSLYRDHEISRERRWRGKGPLAGGTVRLTVAVLRSFFRHLARRGLVLLDPALDLQGPRRHRKLPRQIPTARQMSKLLHTPDISTVLGKRDRAALELLYASGLRNAELCGLRLCDVDLQRRTVFVAKGKGGKERVVPVGRKAVEALTAYLGVHAVLSGRSSKKGDETDLPLFLNRVGRPLNPEALRRLLALHTRKLGLPATPHTLRHACATHLLRGGAGIRQIQALLGHGSLESTEIYTKVETGDLRVMLDRHHPRSGQSGAATNRV